MVIGCHIHLRRLCFLKSDVFEAVKLRKWKEKRNNTVPSCKVAIFAASFLSLLLLLLLLLLLFKKAIFAFSSSRPYNLGCSCERRLPAIRPSFRWSFGVCSGVPYKFDEPLFCSANMFIPFAATEQ